ncbi:MAG: isoaspartyl peptidase/L-asparaginase [Promethearchaeati archaeon SRVP18_Atabeyarchaeia-1]
MRSGNYVIIAHGGAGEVRTERERIVEKGVREAVTGGFSKLSSDGSALDAVEECVRIMEDNPSFNAGTGSVLTMKGTIEMDASISDGKTLNCGAVAMISNVRHPVSLARAIMEKTDHVLVVGVSAEKMADRFGLEKCDPRTDERVEMWKEAKTKFEKGEVKYLQKTMNLIKLYPDLGETVGAIAVDASRNIAAATSTGGIMLKLPGRVGDTPIIGAGNYADENSGASCTGIGEVAVRLCLGKTACEYVRKGLSAQESAKQSIDLVNTRQGGLDMGIIVVDKNYNHGLCHNTRNLVWSLQKKGMNQPRSGLSYPR